MALSFSSNRRALCSLSLLFLTWVLAALAEASPSCSFSSPAFAYDDHHDDHGHDDHGDHHHHHHNLHNHDSDHGEIRSRKLPEELAEEEDLALDGLSFQHHSDHHHDDHHHDDHHHHHHSHFQSEKSYEHELSPLGIWIRAMGCSLLVSMASLICLTILPLIFVHGKPSGAVVDCLAVFGVPVNPKESHC